METKPNDGQVLIELGHCYQLAQKYMNAFEAYQAAVMYTMETPSADLWFGIGLLYYRCGKYDLAENAF
jgi:tetratricopeptide (TPR) repeat protein